MSFDARYLGSEIQPAVTLMDTTNLLISNIQENMERLCREKGIPAKFEKNTVTSGGFLNKKTYDCLVIRHPNPPQEYCAQLYTIVGNTITFNYIGNSKAFREQNEYEVVRGGGGTTIQKAKYMFTQPDKMSLQQELGWHKVVIEQFNSLVIN